ncbi:MarR family winged helix-turn-helix transcriptional regulator [Sulfitobacter sabulilitoris]|uniref:Winged helix-turn-helix transcriptional regulator n=1 Tax=Sulfitobacter sabulilitoris TaxID=2562655 RepID=A0A5S3PI82_9RHOB|nr:MarR family winged helix-turn-helix transcriptional regulator [Sulfitobacter sabulilitoris]TMM54063.1 winged helix-turn-helix transcriptional regulator [Sulfitobacter sabulilitoris]
MIAPAQIAASGSKDRLRLWLRLLKLSRRVDAQLRDRLRTDFGSTLPRFDVMAALARDDAGLKMSQLSGVLRVSNGNVTGIVDRLALDKLVERVPVPGDRRAMVVRLTQAGRAEFTRQATAHEAWINEMLGAFTPQEARHMAARLAELAEKATGPETKNVR